MSNSASGDKNRRFIREDGLSAAVATIVEPVIEELGYRLVRVKVSPRDGTTVQIMADKAGGGFAIEDCTLISRRLSPVLDAHDPMPGGYFLEVSSPGIDRPLVRPSDFDDWAGYEAKVELRDMIDGRRRFRGVLDGYENGEARLKMHVDGMEGEQVIGLPVHLIQEAKLVMTDDLIKASLARKRPGEELVELDGGADDNGVETA
ncbi:MAG: ribosome maturation factor RimP [Hyphomicrobiales bacterium]|nr:ribosome maturation factor RimP [Hyphomicrobiales bacterium]